ncbi:MAG: hypothetical protein DLM61_01610 [Pseudonocardiales bacterium]|nr:MAG: hypothetical protein DLM61_01610 [Pseudonocardiales bacterium]
MYVEMGTGRTAADQQHPQVTSTGRRVEFTDGDGWFVSPCRASLRVELFGGGFELLVSGGGVRVVTRPAVSRWRGSHAAGSFLLFAAADGARRMSAIRLRCGWVIGGSASTTLRM